MSDFLEKMIPIVTTYGLRILGVLALLAVVWIFGAWTRKLVRRSLKKVDFDDTLTIFFGNLARWAILLMGGLGCLGIFGVETTSFAAVLGAAGLAVGLAFQGSLSNLASGVMLLIFRPFKVGDVIAVAGEKGKVQEIGIFTTIMDTPDNRRIILPNGTIFGSTIENVTFHDLRRVDVAVGVDYTADMDTTREILERAAQDVPGKVDDPASQVALCELGASSVDWVVRVWCQTGDFWAVKEATTRAIKMELDGANIGIPFPQSDVHLDPVVVDALRAK